MKKFFFITLFFVMFFPFFNTNDSFIVDDFNNKNTRESIDTITFEADASVLKVTDDSYTIKIENFNKKQGTNFFDSSSDYEFYEDLSYSKEIDLVQIIDKGETIDFILKNSGLKSSTSYSLNNIYFFYTQKGNDFSYNPEDIRIFDISESNILVVTKLSQKIIIAIFSTISILLIILIIFLIIFLTRIFKKINIKKQFSVLDNYS